MKQNSFYNSSENVTDSLSDYDDYYELELDDFLLSDCDINAIVLTHFSSNFLFLRDDFSDLYDHGYEAEDLFMLEKYNQCVRELGNLAEGVTDYLLMDIDYNFQSDVEILDDDIKQKRRIDYLYSLNEITYEERDLLHRIRKARNPVSHFQRIERRPKKRYTRSETRLLMQDCFKITCLFANRYGIQCNTSFTPPYISESYEGNTVPDSSTLTQKRKEAILNSNYDDIIIYSMILMDGHTVAKYRSFCPKHIQDLAELFLCIRRKRAVPSLENFSYTKHRDTLTEYYPLHVIEELNSLFLPEYRAALNDLVGKISEIAGEIE